MLLHCETEDGSAGRGAGLAAGWLRPETLETLIELNELCLALVAEQAVSRGAPASPLLRQVAELWQVLDPAARRRAAGCPYLLVDAGFADPVRWRQPGSLGVGDGADAPYTTFFTVPAATELARLVLTYAWHLARSQSAAARLLLGMPDPCAALIAHLGLRQIQALAEAHPEWLRPRWPTRVRVLRELEQRRRHPAFVAQLVADLPEQAVLLAARIERHARVEIAHHLRLDAGRGIHLAGLGHGPRLLGVVGLGVEAQPLDLVDELGEGIEVGHGDHLTDLGVRVAAGAGRREAAEEGAAAGAPAEVGLLGVSLLHGDLLGGAHVGQGQHDIRGLALETDAADHRARHTAEEPADQSAEVAAAGVAVLGDHVGHQHVVGGLHLALADVRAAAHLAGAGERALLLGRREALAAIEQREALRLRHEHLDERLGGLEVVLQPPLVLRLGDRERADLLVAGRNFRRRLIGGECTEREPEARNREGWQNDALEPLVRQHATRS